MSQSNYQRFREIIGEQLRRDPMMKHLSRGTSRALVGREGEESSGGSLEWENFLFSVSEEGDSFKFFVSSQASREDLERTIVFLEDFIERMEEFR